MKPLAAQHVWPALQRGGSARLDAGKPARFKSGDCIVVKDLNPAGHIRLPSYVRGCTGKVQRNHGEFILPDLSAQGVKTAEHLYSVRFDAATLWQSNSADAVYVDLFESYIEPA